MFDGVKVQFKERRERERGRHSKLTFSRFIPNTQKTRFPLILPILDEGYVADRILDSVQHNDEV